jgi:hypothetical protein
VVVDLNKIYNNKVLTITCTKNRIRLERLKKSSTPPNINIIKVNIKTVLITVEVCVKKGSINTGKMKTNPAEVGLDIL